MIQNISPSADSFLTAINQLQAQVQRAQEEIGSGLRVNRPSDDPSVVTDILQINSSLARNTQIGQNLSNEFFLGRFKRDGETKTILEVE